MRINCDCNSQAFGANSTRAAKEVFADGIGYMMRKGKIDKNFNEANMFLEDIYQHAPDIKIGGKYIDRQEGSAYLKMPIGKQDNLIKVNTHDSDNFLSVLKKLSYLIHNHIGQNKLSIYSGTIPGKKLNLAEMSADEIVNKIMKRTVNMD